MTASKASLETWHWRLRHVNIDSVLKLSQKDMVSRMEITGPMTHNGVCKACLEGKQHREPIPQKSMVEDPRILHWTYSDVCGPMQTQAWTGHSYFVTYINGYSH
ncbi:hypothetical protein PAXRUDRAFT_148724, partial [Paxillus rubicundulus Ve08.2h10]